MNDRMLRSLKVLDVCAVYRIVRFSSIGIEVREHLLEKSSSALGLINRVAHCSTQTFVQCLHYEKCALYQQ
jgi:hypothetical protein